ncbi:right-handed parallel beta-helix repeat-containing protein [Candidatus Neomarinimicrobiota bacterium]
MAKHYIFSRLIVSVVITFIFSTSGLTAETVYVDNQNGDDNSPGTIDEPLKTIHQAAELINNTDEGSTILKILPGIYQLQNAAVFKNTRPYTKDHRLIIEAAVLPDDAGWKPELMPILISSAIPSTNFGFDCSIGLKIEVNHVTVRGLKLLGNPVSEVYYYPIARESKDKTDLIVTQCLFIGDEDALPIQSGVLAHGNNIIIDHCIFYNCRNSVVFYFVDEDRTVARLGGEMNYCIIDGGYETGIWTAAPDKDFKFHHNIITRCANAWIHNTSNTTKYNLSNCIITDNEKYVSRWTNENGPVQSEQSYIEDNIIWEGTVQLVKKTDVSIPKDYLHVVPGTLGSDLGAGLFSK